jgi:hypothetical protein
LGLASTSSTSCAACQKKRYGLMVVPKTATMTVSMSAEGIAFGHNIPDSAFDQAMSATSATAT